MIPNPPIVVGVEFRAVVGFPGYCVGSDGSVWSCRPINGRGPLLSVWRQKEVNPDEKGYCRVSLMRGGRLHLIGVHILVLTAFVGPCPEGMEGCHENGNPSDNRLTNLRWDTPQGNQADRVKHGTHSRGERNGRSKLTAAKVKNMRRLHATGEYSLKELADIAGVSAVMAGRIINGKNWVRV